MKTTICLIGLFCLGIASQSLAQGVIKNTNYDPANGIDAPIYHGEGILIGPEWSAQLFAGPSEGSLQPVGSISPFGRFGLAGYWQAPEDEVTNGVAVPGVAPGATAYVQVWAWDSSYGSLSDAMASGGPGYVYSPVFEVVVGPAGDPAPLVGLESFSLLVDTLSFRGDLDIRGDMLLVGSGAGGNFQIRHSSDLSQWRIVTTSLGDGSGTADVVDSISLDESSGYYALQKDRNFTSGLVGLWEQQSISDYNFTCEGVIPLNTMNGRCALSIEVRNGVVSNITGNVRRWILSGDKWEIIEFEPVASQGGFEKMTVPGIYQEIEAKGSRVLVKAGEIPGVPQSYDFVPGTRYQGLGDVSPGRPWLNEGWIGTVAGFEIIE